MIVDLGCGDGRGALALAAAEPGSLVLAVDAVADARAETSRRAARTASNIVFVAASAEAFADALPGRAHAVVVTFPWGSLLRGLLGADAVVGAAIASLLVPDGRLSALVSLTPRDVPAGLPPLDASTVGCLRPSPELELVEARPASREEVRASGSTWGRRLLAGGGAARPVWRLEWRRCREG